MRSSPKMRQVIEKLADKHGISLAKVGALLRLDMPHYDSLYIQRTGPTLVSVAHRFESEGGLIPDPEVVFFAPENGEWIAIRITQSIGGSRAYAQLSDDGMRTERSLAAAQADLADFVKMWAQNIEDQGWLEHGVKHLDLGAQLTTNPLFALGQVVATPGALEALEEAQQTPKEFLVRHVQGEWGSIDTHDQQANARAVVGGDRILSAYETKLGVRIWLITEWDRSITTLLRPEEY